MLITRMNFVSPVFKLSISVSNSETLGELLDELNALTISIVMLLRDVESLRCKLWCTCIKLTEYQNYLTCAKCSPFLLPSSREMKVLSYGPSDCNFNFTCENLNDEVAQFLKRMSAWQFTCKYFEYFFSLVSTWKTFSESLPVNYHQFHICTDVEYESFFFLLLSSLMQNFAHCFKIQRYLYYPSFFRYICNVPVLQIFS